MKCLKVLGMLFVVLVAVSALTASTASAVTFLLSAWLLNGAALTTPDLVEILDELIFINLNAGGFGVTVEVLCSLILVGFVGPSSFDEIVEVLNLAGETVTATKPVACADTQNCEEALVSFPGLPWLTELELISSDTGEPFADLFRSFNVLGSCIILGISVQEECKSEIAAEVANQSNGTGDITYSEEFQELAGMTLGECGGRAETAIVEGLGEITAAGGGTLTVSE